MSAHAPHLRMELPAAKPPDEEGGGGRMLTVLLVAAAVIAVLYLALGRSEPAPGPAPPSAEEIAAQEAVARRWASGKLHLSVTGVSCDGRGACTIATETGRPFPAACGLESCTPTCH